MEKRKVIATVKLLRGECFDEYQVVELDESRASGGSIIYFKTVDGKNIHTSLRFIIEYIEE